MRRMIRRVSVLFIVFTMLMVCFPLKVQAQVESETLLFKNGKLYIGECVNAFEYNEVGMKEYTKQTDKWKINGKTLTLNGFSFETTSGLGLVVADGGIIELAAGSVNTIKTSGAFEMNSKSRNHQIFGEALSIQGKGTLNTYGIADKINHYGASIISMESLTLKDCILNLNYSSVENLYWIASNRDVICDNVEINIYTNETLNTLYMLGIWSEKEDVKIKNSFINIRTHLDLNNLGQGLLSNRGAITIENSILNIENLDAPGDCGISSDDLMNIKNSYVSVKNAQVALESGVNIIAENATVTGAKEEFSSGISKLLTSEGVNPVIVDNKTFNFTGLTANGVTQKETTTELQLTFDSYVPSLTEANITVTGAKKGALTKVSNRGEYTLAVSDITVKDGENVTVDIAAPNLKFKEKKRSVVVYKKPQPVPVNYDMLEGADAKWSNGTKEGMVLKSNGDLDKFKELRINGNIVGKENYLAQKGSTIITLKPEYLNTLTSGKYSVEMVFSDGSATTSFVIKNADKKPETKSPNTGDHTNTSTWILLMVMSGSIIMLSRFAKARSRD